jgi:hypothetical protein
MSELLPVRLILCSCCRRHDPYADDTVVWWNPLKPDGTFAEVKADKRVLFLEERFCIFGLSAGQAAALTAEERAACEAAKVHGILPGSKHLVNIRSTDARCGGHPQPSCKVGGEGYGIANVTCDRAGHCGGVQRVGAALLHYSI